LIFCPIQRALPFARAATGLLLGTDTTSTGDVARPLADPVGAALGARPDALERRTLVRGQPRSTTSESRSMLRLFSAFAAALAITL
jgi:hypothetical protein